MTPEFDLLKSMFDAAVASAQPGICLPPHLPPPTGGRTVVVGAGKASAEMARVLERHWEGDIEGVVVTRYGFAVPCEKLRILEAAHPVPDAAGIRAAREIMAAVSDLGAEDQVIVLISGGGSALLTLPGGDLTLGEKMAVNRALLASGAPISAMNVLRKHLSAIKGGRLARAANPARVWTLAISDIPGDDPALIASGPTVPDPSTSEDARAVIKRYGLELAGSVERHLLSDVAETPKPGDSCFATCETRLIATPGKALEAAAQVGRRAGNTVVMLGDDLEGEARDVARAHARMAERAEPGTILLSGGELTVTLAGTGRGGPNGEYVLALAEELRGHPRIHALACDTDGIDGSEDNAGAVIGPTTLSRGKALGLDAGQFRRNNDSYGFFEALGDLIVTGPTQTNVNDFRAILVT